MADTWKYDVAFSFLGGDEPIAKSISDLLRGRWRTFVFSEHQRKLAGRDGEAEFGRVFREEARTVVVLYRQGWGETSWTRVESNGIRDRAYDEGHDFMLLIPLTSRRPRPSGFRRTGSGLTTTGTAPEAWRRLSRIS